AGAKPTHNRRVDRGGGGINEHLGPPARRVAGNIEQILDADDRPPERAESYAGTRSRGGRVPGGAGGPGRPRTTGAATPALRVRDARESLFQPFTGGAGRRQRDL